MKIKVALAMLIVLLIGMSTTQSHAYNIDWGIGDGGRDGRDVLAEWLTAPANGYLTDLATARNFADTGYINSDAPNQFYWNNHSSTTY